jgi:hypothetical protein
MSSAIISVFCVILFYFLTPGILVTLPKNAGKKTVAAVHALIFGVVFFCLNRIVLKTTAKLMSMS